MKSARLSLIAAIAFAPCLALAQDRTSTILVLDGSGSMWGQIDGIAKISIAQDVIGDLLATLSVDRALGLTVYGHRVKGDCSDIETLVAPDLATRSAIARAVKAIKPKGKTPLSAAVVAAAEALRHREEKATVILVSDGRETCDADPCAIGRTLEETGVDFTAHVIGFDVEDDARARADLQCLADETGGQFVLASDAAELSQAFAAINTEPEPVARSVSLIAALGDRVGPRIEEGLSWRIVAADGTVTTESAAAPTLDLLPGEYGVSVMRLSDETSSEARVTVSGDAQTVLLVLPDLLPDASIDAPDSARQGETIAIDWSGPGGPRDAILLRRVGDPGAYVKRLPLDVDGPRALRLPGETGAYTLVYAMEPGARILASRPIAVTAAEVSLKAPDTAEIGSEIGIDWTGPDYPGDVISVHEADGDVWAISKTKTSDGSPATLRMPPRPGAYEIRYQLAEGQTIVHRVGIGVKEAVVAFDAPAQAEVGDSIAITWKGPGNPGDFISVDAVGGDIWAINKVDTDTGNPVTLRMPGQPGTYELRYQLAEQQKVIYRLPITVTEATVTLDAPPEAEIGETIQIAWSGPGNPGDVISVKEDGGDVWAINKVAVADGSPVSLRMPATPGAYELRYQLAEAQEIVFRAPITITDAQIMLSPPQTAEIGQTIEIPWSGPDNPGDFISVKDVGGDIWAINKVDTRLGSPARLRMPQSPGAYEIRYQLAEEQQVVHAVPIDILPATVTLEAPDVARAGGTVEVIWEGPNNPGDMISVHVAGGDIWSRKRVGTDRGSPVTLSLPEEPGDYEIRYQLAEEQAVIARRKITLE